MYTKVHFQGFAAADCFRVARRHGRGSACLFGSSGTRTRTRTRRPATSGNVRKHAIAFAEVSTLFTSGVDYLEIFDVEHSAEDERFICIGPIARGIVVVLTVDVEIDVIRIISARLATRRESRLYADFLVERSDGR